MAKIPANLAGHPLPGKRLYSELVKSDSKKGCWYFLLTADRKLASLLLGLSCGNVAN